jgi:hypothetical protein
MEVHYPTTSTVRYTNAAQAIFEARASIMYPELKSRVEVVFAYDADTLLGWPESVGGGVKVERVYGSAEYVLLPLRVNSPAVSGCNRVRALQSGSGRL